MTSKKKRKYGDLASQNVSSDPEIFADVFAAFTGRRPSAPPEEPTPVETPVATPVGTTVGTTVVEAMPAASDSPDLPKGANQPQYLDATHTASEQRVYSVMYRETISKGIRERHYGPKELCVKTGIRSDKTVRLAVRGLCQKLSIEVVSHDAYFPQGPRYRIYEPKEVQRRRKAVGMEIDPQTKKITTPVSTAVDTTVGTAVAGGGKSYSSTGAETTGVTPVSSTGVIKEGNSIARAPASAQPSSSNSVAASDDEAALPTALSDLISVLTEATLKLTGHAPRAAERQQWRELAELLAAELSIAAARTDTISSVPAFLSEHLRRRLWKKDQAQLAAEKASGTNAPKEKALSAEEIKHCPDCGGSGLYYPQGYEKGVARCRHAKLEKGSDATPK